MVEVNVRDRIWKDVLEIARRKRKSPDALVNLALKDFIQQVSDEDLLLRSQRAARRAGFKIADTEKIIREYRRNRRAGR